MPVDARDLDDPEAGETVRASLAHGGDIAPAHAGIADAGPIYLDPWLDHVAHRPDPYGLARPRDLELGRRDARILAHRFEDGVAIHREPSPVVTRRRAEDDVVHREGSHLK